MNNKRDKPTEKGRLSCMCGDPTETRDNVRLDQSFGECSCGKPLAFVSYREEDEKEESC